ncbi:AI-2E family transporter [Sulfurovum sp.]|uniref:AI-2E family transporter n=1 Tax=Sulfurovum sp. TaxID=1969726 RepID=UPI0028680088|nr:AI-2E family transporter [Sulfurovum sp.]
MKQSTQQTWPINQLLIFMATLSIVLTAMKFSSAIIVPFLIAVSIAILLAPLLSYLETKRIPRVLSLIFVTVLVLIPIVALGGYIGEEVKDFVRNYQSMQKEFHLWLGEIAGKINKLGISIEQTDLREAFDQSNFGELIRGLATQAKNQFSNIFLIFFIVAFILMESNYLHNKLIKVMKERKGSIDASMEIIEKIKRYFFIKVKTSLMTAIWILLVLWFYDIRYALLWATLVFFLNFIPVIGSIIAAIPAIALALIDHSLMTALWIAMWYIIVNTVIGNILEPHIMGKGLGLSALTIFLSMIFWGWMFGPAGMILSVPLTMGLQFIFDQYDETKWLAFMLGDYQGKS